MTLLGPLIFTGNAHPALGDAICRSLDIPMGRAEVSAFSNDNIFVRICENVRERDVFLVQSGARPVNASFMELLIMIDAVRRASAGRITAVIPYFPYGRSDKKDQPRVPITARLIANLLETAGASRILTMDLHAGQIQGFFNIPTDELTALGLLGDAVQAREFRGVVVAPDLGSAKRARNMAERLGVPLALCEKRRVANDDQARSGAASDRRRGRPGRADHRRRGRHGGHDRRGGDAAQGARREGLGRLHPRRALGPRARAPGAQRAEPATDTLPMHEPRTTGRIHTGQSVGELFASPAPKSGAGAGPHPSPLPRKSVDVGSWERLRVSQGG